MFYEERVVAFIDILGFKCCIDKSKYDEDEFQRIFITLNKLKEFFLKEDDVIDIDYSDIDTQVIQISDSLIISRLIQEEAGIFHMFQDCSFAIHLLIENGFLCRGSIKYGKMFHKGTTLFGPAYIEAVLAEKEESLPIIKFDEDIFEIVKQFPANANKGFEDWEIDYIKEDCNRLNDSEYFLDYFTDYQRRVGCEDYEAYIHYTKLRNIIIEGLRLPETDTAYNKYVWAKEQFNLSANHFGMNII